MTKATEARTLSEPYEPRRHDPFRYAPVMIQTTDPDGCLLAVNERWQLVLGYGEHEAVGRNAVDFLSPESAHRVRELSGLHLTHRDGHVEGIPVALRRRDGDEIDMLLSLVRDEPHGPAAPRIIGFLVANGGEAPTEAAVRQRDTWLRAILENAPVEIVLKDRDGRFIAVSKNVAEERGSNMAAVIGLRTSDFFSPEIARVYEAADRRVIESGKAVQQEVKEVEDGKARYIHNAKFPLRDDTGYIIGICSLSMETTEIRRMEEQLFQAQKMEAVGQLTGGVAHDFNNLLMVISGNLDLIDAKLGHDSPEIQAAMRAIDRGADLTRRLLAFSRQQILQPQPVVLADLLQEIGELIRRTMGQSIILEIDLPAELPKVMADPAQLHNAILNLALNARDAMPQGGTLTVRAETVWLDGKDAKNAGAKGVAAGTYVRLSVADTGTGITPDVLERVFDPFFTTKGVGQGSGLGLSMVYGFVKQSGGDITIDSAVARGTTVNLFLPLAQAEADTVPPAEPSTAEPPRGAGETVLLLDDDPAVRTLCVNMLTDLGYRVTMAADAGEALAAHDAAGRFDLLVSDILIGTGPRGTEVAGQLLERQPDLGVLMITGYGGGNATDLDLPEGAALLAKPFSRQDLASVLRSVLAGGTARAAR